MQFQVPQFITIEDKLIGPLSLRQFLLIAGALGISAILYNFLQMTFWIILSGFLVIGTAAIAIVKINGQPLHKILLAALEYLWNPRTYVWKREMPKKTIEIPEIKTEQQLKEERGIKAMIRRILMK